MKFYSVINEANQETVAKLEKIEEYFGRKGDFREIYPEIYKNIHHVRQENYAYRRGNKKYYAVMIVLKDNLYNQDEDEVKKTIKDLELLKDNKARVERNNLMIKILIPETTEEM